MEPVHPEEAECARPREHRVRQPYSVTGPLGALWAAAMAPVVVAPVVVTPMVVTPGVVTPVVVTLGVVTPVVVTLETVHPARLDHQHHALTPRRPSENGEPTSPKHRKRSSPGPQP